MSIGLAGQQEQVIAHNNVEPTNTGHIGISHFVLCREVENVLVIQDSDHLV